MNLLKINDDKILESFNASNIDIIAISKRLSENVNNKHYYVDKPIRIFQNCTINQDYSTRNLRETVCQDCFFNGSNLKEAGLASSLFVNTSFLSCDYTDTNFQCSDFRECSFNTLTMSSTRFSKSVFKNTTFNNCMLEHVQFQDCVFIDCIFTNCKWKSVCVENVIFRRTKFDKMEFKSMNFEFSTFDKVNIIDSKLPFPTIPFIYNGITYLKNTTDNVRVSMAGNSEGMSKECYLDKLCDLKQYYIATHNFFPLCNIFIANQQFQEALICIVQGIKMNIRLHRFRMLVNFCKHIKYIDGVTPHICQEIYIEMISALDNETLQAIDQENLSLYLPIATDILLNNEDVEKSSAIIMLETDIESVDNSDSIAMLYSNIDTLLCGVSKYSIQLRHNSPITAIIQMISDPDVVESFVLACQILFQGLNTLVQIKNYQIAKETEKLQKTSSKPVTVKVHKITTQMSGRVKVIAIKSN